MEIHDGKQKVVRKIGGGTYVKILYNNVIIRALLNEYK